MAFLGSTFDAHDPKLPLRPWTWLIGLWCFGHPQKKRTLTNESDFVVRTVKFDPSTL
jgi:hypothetical protein